MCARASWLRSLASPHPHSTTEPAGQVPQPHVEPCEQPPHPPAGQQPPHSPQPPSLTLLLGASAAEGGGGGCLPPPPPLSPSFPRRARAPNALPALPPRMRPAPRLPPSHLNGSNGQRPPALGAPCAAARDWLAPARPRPLLLPPPLAGAPSPAAASEGSRWFWKEAAPAV